MSDDKKQKIRFVIVKSPVVGTLTQSGVYPCGDDMAPLVNVGDQVEPDTIVCGVEAMMVVVPVNAGVRGIIIERTVRHGDAVGYGDMLFIIEPTP